MLHFLMIMGPMPIRTSVVELEKLPNFQNVFDINFSEFLTRSRLYFDNAWK